MNPSNVKLSNIGIQYYTRARGKFDKFLFIGQATCAGLEISSTRKLLRADINANLASAKIIGPQGVYNGLSYSRTLRKPILPCNAQFKGLTGQNGFHDRYHCTEFQLLNNFHDRRHSILKSDSDHFTMNLWTEKAPCASCSQVIVDFLGTFTNAKINIYHWWTDKLASSRPTWTPYASRINLRKIKKRW